MFYLTDKGKKFIFSYDVWIMWKSWRIRYLVNYRFVHLERGKHIRNLKRKNKHKNKPKIQRFPTFSVFIISWSLRTSIIKNRWVSGTWLEVRWHFISVTTFDSDHILLHRFSLEPKDPGRSCKNGSITLKCLNEFVNGYSQIKWCKLRLWI